jgi:penicillin-binding protein 1A
MDRFPPKDPEMSNTAHRRAMEPDDEHWCRACDMSMSLGSPSLTMEELVRAYAVFANGGVFTQPYYIEEVRDRDGNVLESHTPPEKPRIVSEEVATLTTWMLEEVARTGTGSPARKELGINFGSKTVTTNDEKDTWFVGFTPDVITAVWVGYDTPKSLGVSSTGGRTSLPIWVDYMRVAAPKENDRAFPIWGNVDWAQIDDKTGRRLASGGRKFPFLKGTVPEQSGVEAGQYTIDDLATEL